MRPIRKPGVEEDFFLLLKAGKLPPRKQFQIVLARRDGQSGHTHGMGGVDCERASVTSTAGYLVSA